MTLMLNHITGRRSIKPQLAGLNLRLWLHYELTQIINELSHIFKDSSSCIDLVFLLIFVKYGSRKRDSFLITSEFSLSVLAKFALKVFILHLTKSMSGVMNMQILLRLKMHLHLLTESKYFLKPLSIVIDF